MSDNCIFCRIINKQLASYVIYEDNEFIVILDRFPAAKAHMLVIPKQHCQNIFSASDTIVSGASILAKKMSHILKTKYGIEEINILQNNGAIAGQTVGHYHVHVLPRSESDEVQFSWGNLSFTDEQMETIRLEIAQEL